MLVFARPPIEARGSWRPTLEAVERVGGVVETGLRRLLRVPAGEGGPPLIDTGRPLREVGLWLGRLYDRGAWFLLRGEAAAARRAGRLLVVLAVGSFTFTLDSVVVAALLLDSGTLRVLAPVAEVAAVGAALAMGVAWWMLRPLAA